MKRTDYFIVMLMFIVVSCFICLPSLAEATNVPVSENGNQLRFNRWYYMHNTHVNRGGVTMQISSGWDYALLNKDSRYDGTPIQFLPKDSSKQGQLITLNDLFEIQSYTSNYEGYTKYKMYSYGIALETSGSQLKFLNANESGVAIGSKYSANTSYITIGENISPVWLISKTILSSDPSSTDIRWRLKPARNLAGNITVKYVEYGTGKELASSTILTSDFADDPYSIRAQSIDGYTLIQNTSEVKNGYFTSTAQTVLFYYQKITYPINITIVPNTSSGHVSIQSESLAPSEKTKISAVPSEGYRFSHWEKVSGEGTTIDNVNASETTLTMGSESPKIQAVFELIPPTYPIKVEILPNGSAGSFSTGNSLLEEGQITEIRAIASKDYQFSHWEKVSGEGTTIDNVNASETTLTMGSESPMIRAIFDKLAPPIKELFPDSGLAEGVATKLNVSIDTRVPIKKLENLTSLKVPNNQIKSLVGLNHLPNLKELDISHNQVSDFGILSEMLVLTKVNLSSNGLVGIDDWSIFSNILSLNLSDNALNNIDGYSLNSKLTFLDVSCNQLLDVSSLQELVNAGANVQAKEQYVTLSDSILGKETIVKIRDFFNQVPIIQLTQGELINDKLHWFSIDSHELTWRQGEYFSGTLKQLVKAGQQVGLTFSEESITFQDDNLERVATKKIIPRTSDNWSMSVVDTRGGGNDWKVAVKMEGTFKDPDKQVSLPNDSLIFRTNGKSERVINNDYQVIASGKTSNDDYRTTFDYQSDEGLLLNLVPLSVHQGAHYQVELSWSIIDAP
ncbi:InlB B-repeat-containing protein [Vagococcus xieshaowenii]|uniref:Bacterial repeat domain-containing protein n=1 Tax=Vagococcus xieshaowenii TaxID=2562451 RepID=A0AAJ5EGJ4_9ENTE|nr:MucBP domain-containing protein [Vagococcus xieshaowenii]QCA29695.1 hypothetical protein E4Z98_09930 [Vagococcus xieshaowenii]TFZ42910.1 hypothetical protein E4031_01365 [Vagococcus xieshaowenii]